MTTIVSEELIQACADGELQVLESWFRAGKKLELLKPDSFTLEYPHEAAAAFGQLATLDWIYRQTAGRLDVTTNAYRAFSQAAANNQPDALQWLFTKLEQQPKLVSACKKFFSRPLQTPSETPAMLALLTGLRAAVQSSSTRSVVWLLRHWKTLALRQCASERLPAFPDQDLLHGAYATILRADDTQLLREMSQLFADAQLELSWHTTAYIAVREGAASYLQQMQYDSNPEDSRSTNFSVSVLSVIQIQQALLRFSIATHFRVLEVLFKYHDALYADWSSALDLRRHDTAMLLPAVAIFHYGIDPTVFENDTEALRARLLKVMHAPLPSPAALLKLLDHCGVPDTFEARKMYLLSHSVRHAAALNLLQSKGDLERTRQAEPSRQMKF